MKRGQNSADEIGGSVKGQYRETSFRQGNHLQKTDDRFAQGNIGKNDPPKAVAASVFVENQTVVLFTGTQGKEGFLSCGKCRLSFFYQPVIGAYTVMLLMLFHLQTNIVLELG